MKRTLIKNCNIINEGEIFESDILIENSIITKIDNSISPNSPNINIIDAEGNYIIPGLIDDQVHFREPGLTHKGNIFSREPRSSTNMFPVDEPKKSLIAGILLVSFFNISRTIVRF